MQITLTGRKIELTDGLHSHVEKRMGKIRKFLDRAIEVRIVLSVEKQRHAAEVTLTADGFILHTKETTEDMYASIDKLADKIEKLLKKHKKRIISKKTRREPKLVPLTHEDETLPEETPKASITATTNVNKEPMSENEAAEKLENSDNEFMMFRNAKSNAVNVIYKKHDGDFGLLTP